MSPKTAKASLAIALMLFCVQLVAAPLLSCCALPQVRNAEHADKAPVDAGMHAMMPQAPGSHAHHHDMTTVLIDQASDANHAPQDGDVMQGVADVGCDHQCNYCLGLYSAATLEQRMQDTPFVTAGMLLARYAPDPIHFSDPLLRPPRYV